MSKNEAPGTFKTMILLLSNWKLLKPQLTPIVLYKKLKFLN